LPAKELRDLLNNKADDVYFFNLPIWCSTCLLCRPTNLYRACCLYYKASPRRHDSRSVSEEGPASLRSGPSGAHGGTLAHRTSTNRQNNCMPHRDGLSPLQPLGHKETGHIFSSTPLDPQAKRSSFPLFLTRPFFGLSKVLRG
jgi:hypothetical protein